MGAILIFYASYWLTTAGLYKFNVKFLAVLGMPFFHMVWGAANGIIFAYFFGKKIYQRFLSILIFAGLTVGFKSIIENLKSVEHVGKFTNWHEYFFDVLMLATLGFILVSLFQSRLKKNI